jgi:hypothetical protein
VLFALALIVPFPGGKGGQDEEGGDGH